MQHLTLYLRLGNGHDPKLQPAVIQQEPLAWFYVPRQVVIADAYLPIIALDVPARDDETSARLDIHGSALPQPTGPDLGALEVGQYRHRFAVPFCQPADRATGFGVLS